MKILPCSSREAGARPGWASLLVWVFAAFLVTSVPLQSSAQSDGVLRVIPYDGFLTNDGGVIDGSLALRFALYDTDDNLLWATERSDEDGRSCWGVASCLVPLYRGAFSVLLGEFEDIEDVLTGDTTHVEAEDAGTGGGVVNDDAWYGLYANSHKVTMTVDPIVPGTYTFAVRAYESHVGDEYANLEVRYDGSPVTNITIEAGSLAEARVYTVDLTLSPEAGTQEIEIVMTNDTTDGGDRNVFVDYIQLSGGYPSEVLLGMSIRDDEGMWTELVNRQRIVPEPYSLWAGEGTNFTVAGDLVVGEALVASGNVVSRGGSITVSGDIDVEGSISAPFFGADLITANANITISTSLDVSGALHVTGPRVCFDSCNAAGGRVMAHESGDVLTLNDAGDFDGGAEVDGLVYVDGHYVTDGNVRLHGDVLLNNGYSIDGDRPWIATGFVDFGTNSTVNIGFNTADWFCFIGGHRFGHGDINEDTSNPDNDHIMRMHTYKGGGDWHIRMQFLSESGVHEEHWATYICVQSSMVDEQSWSF